MADAQRISHAHNFKDLTGMAFGKWTVIELGPKRGKKHSRWWCRCECGQTQLVERSNLTCGKSAGCWRCRQVYPDGHGMSQSSEYSIWSGIHQRCSNPAFPGWSNYGGRGISVCERWTSFERFYEDMGPRPSPLHSIDREDNDGNYEPSNCRWATRKVQSRNTRLTVHLTIDGVSRPLCEWSELSGVHRNTIRRRLKIGIPPKEAVFTPPTTFPLRPRDSLGRVVGFARE